MKIKTKIANTIEVLNTVVIKPSIAPLCADIAS